MAETKENINNGGTKSGSSQTTNNEPQDNDGISLVFSKKANPVFQSVFEDDDDEFENPQDNDKTFENETENFSMQEPKVNIAAANDEVILRHPLQLGRYPSAMDSFRTKNLNIKPSRSTSDLRAIKNPSSLILPISTNNRPRSPYHTSHSYNGLNQLAQNPYSSTNPSIRCPCGLQEQHSPGIPGEGGGFQNDGCSTRSFGFITNGNFDPYKQQRSTPVMSTSSFSHQTPTSPEAKKRMFTDTLSSSGSTIYAIFVFVLGISIYGIDYLEIEDESIAQLSEAFSLTLLGLALVYLLYLVVDIAWYKHKKNKFEKLLDVFTIEHIELKETNEGIQCNATLQKALSLRKQLDHRYCFNMDRHSSNFYLKVGAGVFCFGHLIHSFLIVTFRAVILSSTDIDPSECFNTASFILEILYPIYSVILLFFIFKYSNVIINKHRDFHRFGFMHCLSASLCFWIWTIFRETAEYMHHQKSKYPPKEDQEKSINDANNTRSIAGIEPFRFTKMCDHDELNILYQNYSPYLYPFSVEYSILVVGILYIVWVNIGLCVLNPQETDDNHGEDTRECRNQKPTEHQSNVTVHVDCHAANKGLFLGFIALVFTIVSVILFFITYYNNSEENGLAETGYLVKNITNITIMFLMIVAVVFAYIQIIKLDVNHLAHNNLDNFLCLMCLPAFFVYGIFSIIPAILYKEAVAVTDLIFEIIQVLIQTTFIIDGMSRSSNTKDLRKKKPGREFVTFLVICNVAMWIMQTFEVKSHGLSQYRQEFYSKEMWSIVGHMCLPLMMFYRFHSSVCLGDIWKYAYVPSGH